MKINFQTGRARRNFQPGQSRLSLRQTQEDNMVGFADLIVPDDNQLLARENNFGHLQLPCWVGSRKHRRETHYFLLHYWPNKGELQEDPQTTRTLQQVIARELDGSFKFFPSLAAAYTFYNAPNHYNCSHWVVRVARGKSYEEVDLRHYRKGPGFQNTNALLPSSFVYSSVPKELLPGHHKSSKKARRKHHRDHSPKAHRRHEREGKHHRDLSPKGDRHRTAATPAFFDLTGEEDSSPLRPCAVCNENEPVASVNCTEGHRLCWECARPHVRIQVEEERVQEVTCPRKRWGDCKGLLCFKPSDHEAEPELFYRLQLNTKRVELTQAKIPFVQCPECEDYVPLNESNNTVECKHCSYAFCCKCFLESCVCPSDELEAARVRVESALQTALLGVNCPNCGALGQKDEACTHVTCICGTRFCYCCGKTVQMLGVASLYEHNKGYPDRPGSCPSLLEMMSKRKMAAVDGRRARGGCPPNATGALIWFHQKRAEAAVAKERQELGPERWTALNQGWDGVRQYRWAQPLLGAN